MKSIKFFELTILVFIASLLMAFANVYGESLDDFGQKPLRVAYADIPAVVARPDLPIVNMEVIYADSCYLATIPMVVKGPENVIEIRPYARVRVGLCTQNMTTHSENVDLSGLEQGDYLVVIYSAGQDSIKKKMTIR